MTGAARMSLPTADRQAESADLPPRLRVARAVLDVAAYRLGDRRRGVAAVAQLRRHADGLLPGRHLHPGWDQGTGADQRPGPDHREVQHGRPGADQRPILDGAALEVDEVPDDA